MMLLSTMTVLATSLGLIACGETLQVEFVVDGAIYKTVELNDEFAKPADPVKAGYTFLGWFEDGSNAEFDFSKEIDANVKVSARWQVNQYSITFDADGGSAVSAIEEDFGTAVSAPSNPTKTGYTFLGWFEEGATEAYDFDTIEARNVSLKAKWDIAQFTITFNTDGGSAVAPITQDYGTAVSAPTAPTKEGHTFAGWKLNGSDYTFTTIPAENIELVAAWTVNSYSISFDANGGSAVNTITQNYGTAVSAPAVPTKDCYDFIGWFEDGSDVAYVFDTIEARNVELTARWDATTYSIVVDVNGGEVENFAKIDYTVEDEPVSITAVPTKDHSEFIGWFGVKVLGGTTYYVGADYLAGSGSPKTDLSDASLDEANSIKGFDPEAFAQNPFFHDVKLIAKWIGEEFTITYDVKGGNALDSATQTVRYDEEFTLAVPTHANYDFAGWYIDGTDMLFEDGKFTFTRDVSLYAKWEKVVETTYALYKHNAEYNGRVANTDEVVLDGLDNISRTALDEKIAELGAEAGDVVEIEIENSEAYVVAKIKLVTGIISNADEFANMVYLSVDEIPSGNWMNWGGYYVLNANIDMTGKTMKKNGRPGTLVNAPGWGFEGTIDGAGYTVINLSDTMFFQLGNWRATIKNLSLINMSKPLATALGSVTIDNCYFEFVISAIHKDGADFTHVLGDSVGDSFGRTAVIKNSVIKVENKTGTKINLINKINAAGEGKTNSLTYTNTILVADNTKVGTDAGEIASKPQVIGLTESYTGAVDGFDSAIWNTTGKHPVFNKFSVTDLAKSYGYGRYILDRENGNAAKINDQDFVATLDGGTTITISKDVFNIGANGMNASPNSSKWNLLAKGSDENYYRINIVFVNFAVNDAVDAANIAKGLNQANWATGFGAGTIVMFNNDIDMAGVEVVNGETGGSSYAGAWGYKGTIDGNGYTISNLAQPLITYTNSACVIKDLTFKNMKETAAVAYKSSGMQLVNVHFDIDAFGMTKLYLLNKTYLSRTATSLTNCSVKISNASSSFECCVDYGPNASYDKGSITVNNLTLTMNAGSFKLAGTEASEGDLTGAQNNVVVNAVLDKTV